MVGLPVAVADARRLRAAVLLPAAVVLLAFTLRVTGYSNMPQPYFDETLYVPDASAYLGRITPHVRPSHPQPEIAEGTWMQPPLGKWMIAAGELVFGDTSFGFRIASILAGTASVGVLYLVALEMFGSVAIAGTAAFFLAIDGLHLVQTRMAMLDPFLVVFVLLGCLFTVRVRRPEQRESPAFHGLLDRNEVRAGICFGAALAVKWSALPYIALGALAAYGWSASRRAAWTPARRAAAVATAYAAIPLAVYLLAYLSFFTQNGPDLAGFVRLQHAMLTYGLHFQSASPARSSAWTWPFLLHPPEYAHQHLLMGGVRIVDGRLRVVRVLALGNPVVWWTFLVAGPALAVGLVRAGREWWQRRWQDAVIVGGYLAGYLPWLVTSRATFVFYLLPSVPFLCLGVAVVLWRLERHIGRIGRLGAGAVITAAALAAILYFPLYAGTPLAMNTYLRLAHLPDVRTAVVGSGR